MEKRSGPFTLAGTGRPFARGLGFWQIYITVSIDALHQYSLCGCSGGHGDMTGTAGATGVVYLSFLPLTYILLLLLLLILLFYFYR